MPETRLLDNQSTTCVTLKNMDDVIGKKLSSRFDAIDRRFDAIDLQFEVIRREMNEGFNRLEHFLTDHWTNNVRSMIATNITVLGTVIASLAFLSHYLK
jgi:predicted phage tail protein